MQNYFKINTYFPRFTKLLRIIFLIPNCENIGNSAEDYFFGTLVAKNTHKRLIVISPKKMKYSKFDPRVDYKFLAFSNTTIESDTSFIKIINSIFSNWYNLMGLLFGSAVVQKFFLYFFKHNLNDSILVPRLGQAYIYNPYRFKTFTPHQVELTSQAHLGQISLRLNTELKIDLENVVENLGLKHFEWFVTFHVRDETYKQDPENIRNCDPQNFISSINLVLSLGGAVVLLGDSKFEYNIRKKGLIDYRCFRQKNSLIDAYLISKSRFFVCTSSGLLDMALLFDTPTLETNVVSMLTSFPPKKSDRIIFKKLYSLSEKKILSLPEFIKLDLSQKINDIRLGYSWIENSSTEIEEATDEMLKPKNYPLNLVTQRDFKNLIMRYLYCYSKDYLESGRVKDLNNMYRFYTRHINSKCLVSPAFYKQNWTEKL